MPGRGILARRNGRAGRDGVVDDDEPERPLRRATTRVPRKARLARADEFGDRRPLRLERADRQTWLSAFAFRNVWVNRGTGRRGSEHIDQAVTVGRRTSVLAGCV